MKKCNGKTKHYLDSSCQQYEYLTPRENNYERNEKDNFLRLQRPQMECESLRILSYEKRKLLNLEFKLIFYDGN